jgi:uncharacterized Fe-S cluster-containing radical SAM superfamily protein
MASYDNDKDYVKELARYDFVHAKMSLKGSNEQNFSMLTGASPAGFGLQLISRRNLVEAGFDYMCDIGEVKMFRKRKWLKFDRTEKSRVKILLFARAGCHLC